MKIALLLYGISLDLDYNGLSINCILDNFYNYKENILDCYEDIDVYLCTNDMSKVNKTKILELYKPKDYIFYNNTNSNNSLKERNIKIQKVIELCLKSNITYDNVIITRFDLYFSTINISSLII